jgi:sugar lactone lactonase YvrE
VDCSGYDYPTGFADLDLPTSEDFTISLDGWVYGVDQSSTALVRSDKYGSVELLYPDVSTWGRGTRFLSDGRLVVAEPDTGSLLLFDPNNLWTPTRLLSNLSSPNGVAIGDDDFIYMTQLDGKVLRVDPSTGDSTQLYDTPVSTDGITFAPDYRTLYWNSENGEVIKVVLDDFGVVIDGPMVHAVINTSSGFSLLDGMTADACGNLYVVEMGGMIHRVAPDGSQAQFLDVSSAPGGTFISAVNFGSGGGGFDTTKLYIMSLGGGMFEVDVGIPGKWEPHW